MRVVSYAVFSRQPNHTLGFLKHAPSSSSVLIIDACETGAEACEHHIRSHIDGEVESVAAANIGVLFNVAVGDFIQRFPELDDVDLEKKNDVSLAKPSH